MASNGLNTRWASPAAVDAKRLWSSVHSLGMAVLPLAPEDSMNGNRRYRSKRLRRGRSRRSPMVAVLHHEKKGEVHEQGLRPGRYLQPEGGVPDGRSALPECAHYRRLSNRSGAGA